MKRMVLFALAAAPLAVAAEPATLTARQAIERIQKNVGVPWREETVDKFKAGNPDTQLKGIATTFMATMDVLQRAAASGHNLVISHEPTFYNHLDKTGEFEKDPVYETKRAFIEKNNLVVWRFHDFLHARNPDSVTEGVTAALGWAKYRKAGELPLFVVPETTVKRAAEEVARKLSIRTSRIVGDPTLKVTRIGLMPGAAGAEAQIQALRRDDVELLMIGETTEWETIAYVRDAATQGRHKALLLLGHVPSEEPGMDDCVKWLRTFISEVPIDFIPAGEPFQAVK